MSIDFYKTSMRPRARSRHVDCVRPSPPTNYYNKRIILDRTRYRYTFTGMAVVFDGDAHEMETRDGLSEENIIFIARFKYTLNWSSYTVTVTCILTTDHRFAGNRPLRAVYLSSPVPRWLLCGVPREPHDDDDNPKRRMTSSCPASCVPSRRQSLSHLLSHDIYFYYNLLFVVRHPQSAATIRTSCKATPPQPRDRAYLNVFIRRITIAAACVG
jgi:hypothetical protein